MSLADGSSTCAGAAGLGSGILAAEWTADLERQVFLTLFAIETAPASKAPCFNYRSISKA
jgi:hypothetical protein